MAKYEIYSGKVVYTDKDGWAVLLDDELWYPFSYFNTGEMDIYDNNGFLKASEAYKFAKEFFT